MSVTPYLFPCGVKCISVTLAAPGDRWTETGRLAPNSHILTEPSIEPVRSVMGGREGGREEEEEEDGEEEGRRGELALKEDRGRTETYSRPVLGVRQSSLLRQHCV